MAANIAFLLRIIIALLSGIQVWIWLRYAGAFWLSDSLGFLKYLVKSVDPLKLTLHAFLILVVPALVVSFLVHRRLSIGMRFVSYACLGAFFSTLYLQFMAGLNLAFLERQIWVYIVAGAMAGLTHATILNLPWESNSSPGGNSGFSHERRKLLGSLGLFAGTAGFLGALAGPLYFWKNRNKYIDMNVGHLEYGEMMVVEVANKPVWIFRRSPDVIRLLEQDNPRLLDPRSMFSRQPEQARNALRSIRPEYFVVYGICTHLGCSPSYRLQGRINEEPYPSTDPQFFCPCHGGVFDLAGRVYKNTPPPVNMVVPAHEFISDKVVRLHFPTLAEEWGA